jgi:isoquinoline 1-oxidoreductase beta subunit
MQTETLKVSRRQFLTQAISAGCLVLSVNPALGWGEMVSKVTLDAKGGALNPLAFVSISPDGEVTIIAHRSEMGQGIRTSLPMVLADELEADWEKVRVLQAEGNAPVYGSQNTDGSRSIRHFLHPMRVAGAMAKEMLRTAAAKHWNVSLYDVVARDHRVMNTRNEQSLGYGEIASLAAQSPVPDPAKVTLKKQEDFRYIGKGAADYDVKDIVSGKARYGIDAVVEDMVYAVVARPPVYGGKVVSFDDSNTRSVKGVVDVVQVKQWPVPSGMMPVGGVAVLGRNSWAVMQGRARLKVEWDDGPNAEYESKSYLKELLQAVRSPGKVVRERGDADLFSDTSEITHEADYYVPHLAHASMEPPVALAVVEGDRCEVWAATQNPWGARQAVAQVLGLPVDKVRVNTTLLGGAFGRKAKHDFVVEAALLAREVGRPVKVMWTREDDIRHDYYHTVSAIYMKASGSKAEGAQSLLCRCSFPSIMATFAKGASYASGMELGQGLLDQFLAIPNLRMENCEAPAYTRIGWFRSVANVQHAFAFGSFMDELAHKFGRDPRDFLLKTIGEARHADYKGAKIPVGNYGESFEEYPADTAKLRKVVELATDGAGWGKSLPDKAGQGLAAHYSFMSYVAVVIEAQVDDQGAIRLPRVDIAIDCGFPVNPDRVRSQMEGAVIMGLSLAKHGEITFDKGKVVQGNFHDFPILRIDENPGEIKVHIVDHDASVPPGGVGEPGLPPVAPALCNAIFAATGQRIRQLPIGNQLKA